MLIKNIDKLRKVLQGNFFSEISGTAENPSPTNPEMFV